MKVLALAPSLFLDRDIQDKSRVHLLLVLATTKLLGTDKQSHALPAELFSSNWVDLMYKQIMSGLISETSDNKLFQHKILAELGRESHPGHEIHQDRNLEYDSNCKRGIFMQNNSN